MRDNNGSVEINFLIFLIIYKIGTIDGVVDVDLRFFEFGAYIYQTPMFSAIFLWTALMEGGQIIMSENAVQILRRINIDERQ